MACVRRHSECRFEAEPKETHVQALKRKFDSLQGEASSLHQVYNLLRTRPEDEAISILRRIRGGESHESILQFVHHGDLLLQLSLDSNASSRSNSGPSGGLTSPPSQPQSPDLDGAPDRRGSGGAPAREHSLSDPQVRPALNSASSASSIAPPFEQYRGFENVEPSLDDACPSNMDDDDGRR